MAGQARSMANRAAAPPVWKKDQVAPVIKGTLLQKVQHAGPGLAGVHRIQQNALGLGQLPDTGRILRRGDGIAGAYMRLHRERGGSGTGQPSRSDACAARSRAICRNGPWSTHTAWT